MADTNRRKKPSGVITVFLSLVLMLVVSLIFTCLESARSEALKLRVRQIADSAIESVFAQYDRVLWDEYGLLFFADRGGAGRALELEQIMLDYAQRNAGGEGAFALADKNWLKLYVTDVTAADVSYATDNCGEIFRYSVCRYMETAGLIDAMSELIGGLNLKNTDLIRCAGAVDNSIEEIIDKAVSTQKSLEEYEAGDAGSADEAKTKEPDTAAQSGYEMEPDEAEEYYNGILDELKAWRIKGALDCVIDDADKISDEKTDDTDLPSDLPRTVKQQTCLTITEDVLFEDACLNEYVMQKTDCYTSENRLSRSGSLETEYIIAGKSSDRENLYSVVKRLVAIRLMFNEAYYLASDSKEGAIAKGIAAAVAGWTGNPAIIKSVEYTVLTGLAARDSLADVRELLNGGAVSLVRAREGTKEGVKFSYEDYLRVLIMVMNMETITYRTMDVLQRRIRISEPSFSFEHAVFAARVRINAGGNSFFPFLPESFAYSFTDTASYAYETGIEFCG